MGYKVKVELLNPDTNEVVDSVSADGVLPNIHKYMSTRGYPYIRANDGTICWESDFMTQGIMCIKDKVDMNPDKCMFKPCIDVTARGNYCTVNYTENINNVATKMGQLDPKYGYFVPEASYMISDLNPNDVNSSKSAINYIKKDNPSANDAYIKVWEWDAENGNGEINSVCLSLPTTVNTYHKNFPSERTTLPSGAHPPICGQTFYERMPRYPNQIIDSTNNFVSNDDEITSSLQIALTEYCMYLDYYETDKNIIFICILVGDYTYGGTTYPKTLNIQQPDGTYETTIYYKIVDKKWLYKYKTIMAKSNDTAFNCLHPLAAPMLKNIVVAPDGILKLNSGKYTISNIEYAIQDKSARVEGNAYSRLFSVVNDSSSGYPLDYPSDICRNGSRGITYIISGDKPVIEACDSVNKILLYRPYYSTNFNTFYTKDKCALMWTYRSGKWHFVEKRTLQGSHLVWRIELPLTPPYDMRVANYYDDARFYELYGEGKSYVKCNLYFPNGNSQAGNIMAIIDHQAGIIAGYISGEPWMSCFQKHLYGDIENPFVLRYGRYGLYRGLYTNFFTAKANLPRTITKTNAHKMRVTVEITDE